MHIKLINYIKQKQKKLLPVANKPTTNTLEPTLQTTSFEDEE